MRLRLLLNTFIIPNKDPKKKPTKILFYDKGQNWVGCKAHPREIEIVSGLDTKEMREQICADIRIDQGYRGDKVTQGMLHK